MIYDLSVAVAALLRAKLVPHQVMYGPLRADRTNFDSLIVFERDRATGDEITAPMGAKQINPESPYNRLVSGAVTVYARSSHAGAAAQHHEDECDRVCDAVICAVHRVCLTQKLPLTVTDSRMLSAEDLKAAYAHIDTWPGSAARIRFNVRTLVRDVTYQGAARPTGIVFDTHAPLVTSEGLPDFDPVG